MGKRPDLEDIAGGVGRAIGSAVLWIVAGVAVQMLIQWTGVTIMPQFSSYVVYMSVLMWLGVGYMVVLSIATAAYWVALPKYGSSGAGSVRSLVKILGMGALISVVAGAFTNPTAAVALGGFIGMIIGYASQQVLNQALAGLFLLMTRPYEIGDRVNVGSVGVVRDINTLFTVLEDDEGNLIMVPNSKIVGAIITKYRGGLLEEA